MILSKSDLRDPLNSFFFSSEKSAYLQNKLFGPIDLHAKFQIF